MKFHRLCMLLLLCMAYAAPLGAQTPERIDGDASAADLFESPSIFSLNGMFRELYTQFRTESYSETGRKKLLVADLKRLRLSPEIKVSNSFIFHVDYDNELFTGSYLRSREFAEIWKPSQYNDFFQPSGDVYSSRDLYYRTRIHRAYVKLVTGDLTTTAGRQQIRFGSGRLWNPLDILNPVSPTDVEGAAEQKGVDAVRLEYYLTTTTELSFIIDQKRKNDDGGFESISAENSNALGRLKTTIGSSELAVLGGRISHRSVGGADISTILFEGTLRGSALYSDPEEGKPFRLASAGYEYNFACGLYFLIEYFYNGNGLNFNRRLRDIYTQSLITGIDEHNYHELSNQFLTYNRHFAGIALGYDITALIRADFFSIYDPQGRGLLFNPSLKYNAFQNIDISAGAMTAHVFSGAAQSSDFDAFTKSGLIYASLNWYF